MLLTRDPCATGGKTCHTSSIFPLMFNLAAPKPSFGRMFQLRTFSRKEENEGVEELEVQASRCLSGEAKAISWMKGYWLESLKRDSPLRPMVFYHAHAAEADEGREGEISTDDIVQCTFSQGVEKHRQRFTDACLGVTQTKDLDLLERIAYASKQWMLLHDMIQPVSPKAP